MLNAVSTGALEQSILAYLAIATFRQQRQPPNAPLPHEDCAVTCTENHGPRHQAEVGHGTQPLHWNWCWAASTRRVLGQACAEDVLHRGADRSSLIGFIQATKHRLQLTSPNARHYAG